VPGPDPYRFTTIAHATHALLGPVSPASIEALLARIPRAPDTRVLDVGCGKGEMLVRALETLGGTGVGVEPNPAFASAARARATQRLPHAAIRIIESTFADAHFSEAPFDLAICTGSIHVFGDWRAALEGMRGLVSPTGWALLGPGYWKRPPDPAYLSLLGGREDQQHSLPATAAMARTCGWQLIACHESNDAEWDAYEHAYAANVRAWCRANSGDPDANALGERMDRWAAAYEKHGRDTMGYALMLLHRE
jgi:cyclopropane fatty-acyl-phospholipid synthase-like methyltransferase